MTMFSLLGVTTWPEVGKYLRETYVANPSEIARQAHAKRLNDYYEGKGQDEVDRIIDVAFKDAKTKAWRKELVGWSGWNNFIARIVAEKATVYSAPTMRKIAGNNDAFQSLIAKLRLDGTMGEVDRQLALHEDVALIYRVRVTPRGRQPIIDVVSPAALWAIAHPNDPTMLVGLIIDQRPPNAKPTTPSYRVWLDDETFMLDGACNVLEKTVEAWTLGRMPCVLGSIRQPGAKSRLLSEFPSSDLLAAQTAVWFQNLLLLKESKSANRQVFLSGDTTNAVTGQSADTETEVVLPEGVQVTPVERGMDLSMFRDNAEAIADTCGANHGVPSSVRRQDGATSGAEMHLRRLPIRELRQKRIPVMRAIETELVEVMAMVNSRRKLVIADEHGNESSVEAHGDLQDFEFSAEGFSIDYGEIAQPLTEAEADAVYAERKRLMLTDLAEETMKRNPDLKSLDDAWLVIEERSARQMRAYLLTQPLSALNGSSSSQVGEKTAEENGANGKAIKDDEDEPKKPIPFPFRK